MNATIASVFPACTWRVAGVVTPHLPHRAELAHRTPHLDVGNLMVTPSAPWHDNRRFGPDCGTAAAEVPHAPCDTRDRTGHAPECLPGARPTIAELSMSPWHFGMMTPSASPYSTGRRSRKPRRSHSSITTSAKPAFVESIFLVSLVDLYPTEPHLGH